MEPHPKEGAPSSGAAAGGELGRQLAVIASALIAAEAGAEPEVERVPASWRPSLVNLLHYLALRRLDVRQLQLRLVDLGLSSLGRAEGHVLANLKKVYELVASVGGAASAFPAGLGLAPGTWSASERLLHEHTREIFGPKPEHRHVYVMVTAPPLAEATPEWFTRMVLAGMDLLRINAAHETPREWEELARRAKAAAALCKRRLAIAVDLPGPKLRTVARASGPRVLKVRPKRDAFGRVTVAASLTLIAEAGGLRGHAADSGEPVLAVPREVIDRLVVGDRLQFTDTRGRRRGYSIAAIEPGRVRVAGDRTAYIGEGTVMAVAAADGSVKADFTVAALPPTPFGVVLAAGDRLALGAGETGDGALADGTPVIGCACPEMVAALKPGSRVLFDDGKIMTRVERVESQGETRAILAVERVARGRATLRADKGINVPDLAWERSALGPLDEAALRFAEAHADMVSLSFVRSVRDVEEFEAAARRADLGLILKIETKGGFEALPAILLASLGKRNLAVMIARGDLAVEVGFARLAEVQEEILWLCEAAHVPVVWATQVLESLAKSGVPTRAEVTDAAMSVRAECVMLNKGPYIEEALATLDSILRRMESHQYKKRNLYRPLRLAFPKLAAAKEPVSPHDMMGAENPSPS